jgi:hypothetical protein
MAADLSLQLSESLTPGRIAAYILAFTIGSFIVDFTWKPRYGKSLPQVGFGDSLLGTVKNWFYYATRFDSWVAEGYDKVASTPRVRRHEVLS